ncbi:MAG TPA: endonuclease domain-containing protein [Candidatus Binatia bacterium]|nr:endonuclease domain-containing protein [Candidatus Binatia bacterium]
MARYPALQKGRARKLRVNQTDVEGKLWSRLRGGQLSGVKFRRQHPIGSFIVDFCCLEKGLIVELDGGQHVEQAAADTRRTEFLEGLGYRILRFWDHDVLDNFDGVLERISEAVESPHTCPLSPEWARELDTESEKSQ